MPLLTAYADDLRVRRLAESTVQVRMLVASMIARQYDLAHVTGLQLADIERRQWSQRSPQTHRSYVQHTRDLCGWMLAAGVRDDDPSTVLHAPRVPRGRPRPIAEDDLELALSAGDQRVRTWVALAAFAGLRCVEIAGLQRADIDDTSGEPTLRVRGKGDKQRAVPLGGGLRRELYRWGLPKAGPVFRRRDGQPFTRHHVSKDLNRYLESLGIPATAHCLRHRYATRLYQESRDIRAVQEVLGHESPSTTAIYTDHSTAVLRDAVAAVEAPLLGGGPTPPTEPDAAAAEQDAA